MASLRARLTAVVVLVAAVALIAAAAITYAAQRSYQYGQVDQRVEAARPIVERELLGDQGPIGRSPGGGGPPPGDEINLPSGTYGEHRTSSGQTIGEPVVASYGEDVPPAPDLPRQMPMDKTITVDSQDGDSDEDDSELQYRARAEPARGGIGSIVVAVPLSDADATLDQLLVVEVIVIGGVLVVLGIVASLVVRLALRPLDRIGTTAGIIAGGDLSRRVTPATPRTEVGRLGLALNAMLDRLEEAFAKRQESEDTLRQFLADASHELRTPLASIRGYAELHRMGAASSPEDVERAMRRIEGEAARMGVLVEDLLALARMDEVREPVRRPVDLAALAADAVDDARAMAPDRSIELAAPRGAVVAADPLELRQVLGNLLRNALVHTPEGTPVEVAVGREDGEVRVDVRDHGDGLPEGGGEALFERFWRAEGGRRRGKAGAGLGLAIVAAIVERHHGRVEAADAEGGGARFTVRLPASPDVASH
ncbi:MAG: HAMP domain-containing sensor histidine kinase [Solirubrobacteraceae bacterium]